ncbi:MAG: hypothetical protein ABSF70_19225, partial [Terracidiphilus sp.]
GGAEDEENVADYWDGIPMTSAELADEMNAIARGEIHPPNPPFKKMSKEDQQLIEEMEPIEVMMSRPGEPLWFEEDDLIREAMEDTLPEMEIIIENECIV